MNLAEKYRPKTLDEIVGQDEIIESLKQKDELSHMIFSGPAGCGKTTLAHVLAKKFKLPIHETNSSDARGIDVIRNEVKRLSRIKGKRIILLDESDHLTSDAQGALRRIMEKSQSAIFILTGNSMWKIIEPIKSRCSNYDFKRLDEKVILRRILEICRSENIKIDQDCQDGLMELLRQSNGDMRKAINILTKVINKDKQITARAVLGFRKPKLATEALDVAINGDFERAQRLVEDAFITSRMNTGDIIKEFYESIGTLQDIDIKIKLYVKLAETERACKIESDPILPLVQLIGFIAYAWLVPHLNSDCPVLK